MEDKFDCIIVGGGVAGLSAAMTLAQADARFLLIERGEFCGAKNVSGGPCVKSSCGAVRGR